MCENYRILTKCKGGVYMSVGERIKERRNELNMSVEELAKKLNKNRATIYRYENGDIENMPIDVLEPLAEALNTTPQYLMGWDNTESINMTVHKQNVEHIKIWVETFGFDSFTNEEFDKLVEYAKFIISMRE